MVTQKTNKLKTIFPVSLGNWTHGSFAFIGSPAQRANHWATNRVLEGRKQEKEEREEKKKRKKMGKRSRAVDQAGTE